MLGLVDVKKIIVVIAIVYATILILLSSGHPVQSGLATLKFAASGAFFLTAFLFLFVGFLWRLIWRLVPVLGTWLCPDLNGAYKVYIHWIRLIDGEDLTGTKIAKAYIRQNFITTSIELYSDESESSTLLVLTKKEMGSGRVVLYYIYHNEPKAGLMINTQPHKGAAILSINPDNSKKIEGNYFTDRHTSGRLVMEYEYKL